MSRREDIPDLLVSLPWWVSVILAGVAYISFQYLFPYLIDLRLANESNSGAMFYGGVKQASPFIGKMLSLALICIATISAILARVKKFKEEN